MQVGLGSLSAPRPGTWRPLGRLPAEPPAAGLGCFWRTEFPDCPLRGGGGEAGVCPQVSVRGIGDSFVLLGGQKVSLE